MYINSSRIYYWILSSSQPHKQHHQHIYSFPHEETDSESVSGMPKTTQLVSRRVRILTQQTWSQIL